MTTPVISGEKIESQCGMEHLLIFLWIKVHYDQNTFTILEYSNFHNILYGKTKMYALKFWER